MTRKNILIAVAILVVIIVAAGLFFFIPKPIPEQKAPLVFQASSTPAINYSFPTNLSGLDFTPQFTEVAATVKNSYNLSAINKTYGISLSKNQQSYLDKNKFILIPLSSTNRKLSQSFDEMESLFSDFSGSPSPQYRESVNAKLVTPDIALHAYHKYFDNTLKALESGDLSDNLGVFLTSLFDNIKADAKISSGSTKDHYNVLMAQIAVARALLENKNPPKPIFFNSPGEEQAYINNDSTIDSLANAQKIVASYLDGVPSNVVSSANQELRLMYEAKTVVSSPLYGAYNPEISADYTQYTPRSHYTESSALRAYFRTMMYLGRNSYFFKSDNGIIDANLLAYEVNRPTSNGVAPYESWKKIMEVTGFFAGESDDLTFTEWNNFVGTLASNVNPKNGVDQKTISTEVGQLSALRLPKILSDVFTDPNIGNMTKDDLLRNTMGLRIFGQRFTLDAWILNNLTAGQEKTDVRSPSMPSALFVPAVLGNKKAFDYSKTFVKKAGFADADTTKFGLKITDVQQMIGKVGVSDWYNSISSSWLYVLSSFSQIFTKGYPLYMQSAPFQDKNIQTALGSYTELKHDTLLYAKQSYAERGGGAENMATPPIVRGFVEPNLIFWRKFQTLVDYTNTLFTQKNILPKTSVLSLIDNFKTDIDFVTQIAEKELTNKTITDDEYEKLRNLSFVYMTTPIVAGQDPTIDSGKTALVADIHTDAVTNQILYEATGRPYVMIALVGDNQQPRAVIGLVYNHYELSGPLGGNRITDEDWKTKVYDKPSTLPAKNFWYSPLLVK